MPADGFWLTTQRLALRRFTADDADFLMALYSDPDVTRYLGGQKDVWQIRQLLRDRILDYYEQHPGLGIWMTIERATGARIGFHLLNHIRGESIVQVGYTLAKHAWGRGFATEMANAVLRHGFVDLELPRITGMASLGNLPSHRVLEKIGLHRRGERAFSHQPYASEGPMAWFERERADWLAERQEPAT